MDPFVILINLFELLACLTGFVTIRKLQGSYWYYFPFYLAVVFITEVSAEYITYALHNAYLNTLIYKYFGIPIQFLFFYWIFYRYFSTGPRRVWVAVLSSVYIMCLLADLLYLGKMSFFASFSYMAGNIVLLVLILMFYIQFINSDEVQQYRYSMMFWVCLGMLLFYLGTLPFYGLRNMLYDQYTQLFYIYYYASFVLNYTMYIMFIIAFIWARPNYSYS